MARENLLPIEANIQCVNKKCSYYHKTGSITKIGKSGKNDYFQCRECKLQFSATYASIFKGKKIASEKIAEVLKAIINGATIRGSEKKFGYTKDTIINWLKQIAGNEKQAEQELMNTFNFTKDEMQKLWTFIKNKTTYKIQNNPS